MTDEVTRAFTVMAEALERASEPASVLQPVAEYVRNDAFRTMARALRAAAAE